MGGNNKNMFFWGEGDFERQVVKIDGNIMIF